MRKNMLAIYPVLILGACGLPANVVVLVPDEGGMVGKIVVANDGEKQELSEPYAAIDTGVNNQPGNEFTADPDAVKAAFAGALASKPAAAAVYVVFFIIGQAREDPRSTETLAQAVAAALATPHADISVVGHSDAIGDDAENMALSLQRARVVYDTLTKGGVPASVIDVSYHGSNNPLVATPRGVPEPRNRRVEVTIR
jgi:outer membrane protein OmpA-like peptidoglycan-associated protein